MKLGRFVLFLSFGLMGGILSSCSSSMGISSLDFASNYRSQETLMQPEFTIQHINDTISTVYYRMRSSDLLYRRAAGTDTFKCAMQLQFSLHRSYSATNPYWSDTASFTHGAVNLTDTLFTGSFSFPMQTGGNAILQVKLTDKVRDYTYRTPIECDKRNMECRQWFGMFDEQGKRLYTPYQRRGARVQVQHPYETKFIVYGYKRSFPMPAPPYALENPNRFNYKPDTIFIWNSSDFIQVPDTGFYHLQLDTNNAFGLTLFGEHRSFPFLTEVAQMVGPLQFITTREEFGELLQTDDLKDRIDQFWLSRSSSPDRARTLIRTYYGRMEEANQHFSSFQSGWRTDRGMIFILFGPPNSLLKLDDGEVWVYGDQNNLSSYNFNFVRVDNPFTDNDLELNRSTIYRYSWSQAVDLWRSGRIFNVNEIQRAQNDLQRQLMRPYFWY